MKCYDPFITEDLVPGQHHELDAFLKDVDLVVIMVGHSQIRQNMDKLAGKLVFDTRNCCQLPGTYRL